jgi:hypothetical protein
MLQIALFTSIYCRTMDNYYFGQHLFIDRLLDDDRAPGAPISPFRQMGISDILRTCTSQFIIDFVQCRTMVYGDMEVFFLVRFVFLFSFDASSSCQFVILTQ